MANVEKLYKLGAVKHAAISLASSNMEIFLRALTLLSMLTDDNDDACLALQETYDIKYIFIALSSAQENYRLEALNILVNMTKSRVPVNDLKAYDIVTKSIILLEEGLGLDSEIGRIQTILTLNLISNLGKASKEFTETYFAYGSVQSFFKCFQKDDKKILRAAITSLAKLDIVEKMLDVLEDEVS